MRALDQIVVQWMLQLPWQQLRHSMLESARMCGGRLCLLCCLLALAQQSTIPGSAQQSTVPGISAASPAIQSTSWPPRFLEIADASIDGQTETSKPCMGLNNGEKDVLCSQLQGAILRPEEHIVESKFQSGGNVRMVVSAFLQS